MPSKNAAPFRASGVIRTPSAKASGLYQPTTGEINCDSRETRIKFACTLSIKGKTGGNNLSGADIRLVSSCWYGCICFLPMFCGVRATFTLSAKSRILAGGNYFIVSGHRWLVFAVTGVSECIRDTPPTREVPAIYVELCGVRGARRHCSNKKRLVACPCTKLARVA